MKVAAIIQARMNSTRLPGKVLLKIQGKTVLEHIVRRVCKAITLDQVIVATTDQSSDDEVYHTAEQLHVDVFRGKEDDVLDRYFQAAKFYNTDHVIRITADCPLMDPKVIDKTVDHYFENSCDFCTNSIEPRTYPDGLDVEVFSFRILKEAWSNAKLTSEREHVTPYI